jgi:uncharacterized protein (DUF736 family)
MPEYSNELRGVLFPQDAETERHPNLTGKVEINGVEYRLAAWKRESAAGNPYLSLKVSLPQEQQKTPSDDSIEF